jgi:PIN domain nuclease of toxin-antitoxin system
LSLLLDSNSLIWWLADERLPPELLLRLRDEQPLHISLVSPWELWVKASAGRLVLPPQFEEALTRASLTMLSPTLADARLAANLPLLHRDPFDRMIIAQALNRNLTVVTADRRFRDYGVDVILV